MVPRTRKVVANAKKPGRGRAGGDPRGAHEIGTSTAWLVFAFATTFLVLGTIVKYLVPGRRLKASGVPTRTLVAGGVLAFVGFFVVPVVGCPSASCWASTSPSAPGSAPTGAWPSTKAALRAVGVSILIELVAAFLAVATWVIGVVVT